MHGGWTRLVFGVDARKHRGAGDNQLRGFDVGIGFRVSGFIVECAKNSDAFHHHIPCFRYSNVDASKKQVQVDYRPLAGNHRIPKIDIDAPKNGHHVTTLEVLRVNLPFDAAKNYPRGNVRIGHGGTSFHESLTVQLPQQHADPKRDNQQWPDKVETDVHDFQVVQQKESSCQGHHSAE